MNGAPVNLREWTAAARIARAQRRVDLAEILTAHIAEDVGSLQRFALAMGEDCEQGRDALAMAERIEARAGRAAAFLAAANERLAAALSSR